MTQSRTPWWIRNTQNANDNGVPHPQLRLFRDEKT